MVNASLKEQLQAVASQLSDTLGKEQKPKKIFHAPQKNQRPQQQHAYEKNKNSNKKPKPRWLDYAQYGVELLRAHFPSCFKLLSEIKPLKKGIKEDLIKRLSTISDIVTDDKACMVKSLAYYVNTAAYHKSMIIGATRIDLDGQPAGTVSEEEAKYSAERHQAKLQAKQVASTRANQPSETA